jgi:cysteinyl-tRNA synthetase
MDLGVHPLAYRLMCLSANYRNELEFTLCSLLASLKRLKRLVKVVTALRHQVGEANWTAPAREITYSRGASFRYQRAAIESALSQASRDLIDAFDSALSSDLMTPQCLPILDEALQHKDLPPEEKLRVVTSFDLTLGLRLIDVSPEDLNLRPVDATLTDEKVEGRVAEREQARRAKDFATADRIRDELSEAGVVLMDAEGRGAWEWMPRLS